MAVAPKLGVVTNPGVVDGVFAEGAAVKLAGAAAGAAADAGAVKLEGVPAPKVGALEVAF